MPSINKVKSASGAKPWKAYVNVKGFDRVSRRFFTEKEAYAWAEPLERELLKQRDGGGVVENIATLTIADLVREYMRDPKVQSLKAYADRERCLTWWVNNCGHEKVMEFNVIKVRAARAKIMPGREPGTANRYLAYMRRCWNWGRDAGLVPQDHRWPSGLMLREPKGIVRYLDDDELPRLLTEAAKHGATVKAAVLVSIATGVRKSELWRVTWRDVDFGAATIRVHLTKNDDESRAVHLPASAAAALKELKKGAVVALDGAVFVTETGVRVDQGWIEYRWRKIRKEAKLKKFRWHDLRHSCASLLAQNGASLPEIGSVLGHKSVQATFRYAHLIAGKKVKGHAALDKKLTGK